MTKILEIEKCLQCFYYNSYVGSCKKLGKTLRWFDIINIPKDCPLPDKPEPITENWLAKIQGMFLDLRVKAINAHFLGEKQPVLLVDDVCAEIVEVEK